MQDSQYCTSAIVSIQFMIILNKYFPHRGANSVDHFARKVRGTNLWRIMQRIQLSPHFHLRAPHFASKVSYTAARQWATMLRRSVPNPCQRTRAVRRPPLGRATSVSGSCDDRLWTVRRPNTVLRSPSNRSFVPKHPFSAFCPRRAALLFLLLSRRKSKRR